MVALQASQDSIRSYLKTVEVPSGRIETVYSDNRHFEAPNWSRDGRFFLINRSPDSRRVAFEEAR